MRGGPAGPESTPGFSEANVLSTYVTMESLLFAGLSAAIALSAVGALARKTPVKPWLVARVTAVILAVVATGAALAWWDLFGGADWPRGVNRKVEAVGILLGILAQPSIAIAISFNVMRPQRHLE